MQVSVETTSGLERRMTVEVPMERVDLEVQKRLKDLAGKAKLDGFRPGKVPMKVIKKRFAGQVEQEVTGEVMQSSLYEAMSQEKLRPAGAPHVEAKDNSGETESLTFTATFEIYPNVPLDQIDTMEVEKRVASVEESDVDTMLETIRKQKKEWQSVERAADTGDRVIVDFVGKIDGVPFDGGKAEAYPIELGAKKMIEGFEDQLKGVTAGDERTIKVTFPEQYHAPNLAGKPAEFDISVKHVEASQLPELNDQFAESLGVTEGGLSAFREQVKANMQRELDQAIRNKAKQVVLDKLVESVNFEIPKVMLDNEVNTLIQQEQQRQASNPNGPGNADDIDAKAVEDRARKRVVLGLILSEVILNNDLKASPAKVRETVEKLAAGYERPEEVISYYYSDKQRLAEIENVILEDEAVDWVMSKAKITENVVTFDELMTNNR